MKPLTAYAIIEANRAYWSGQGRVNSERLKVILDEATDDLFFRVQDILAGRVREGWPSRDAAAPEEDG